MPQRTLVLCYHNLVGNALTPGELDALLAVPVARFAAHLDYLVGRYEPATFDVVERGENGPRHRLVLTFDDGYRSVLTLALPLLQQHQIPAYVFVNPEFVGGWNPRDLLSALAFYGSRQAVNELASMLGVSRLPRVRHRLSRIFCAAMWQALRSRGMVVYKDIQAVFERYADDQLRERLERSRLLSWNDLQVLRERGMRVGNHTHRHVELDGLSRSTIRSEITEAQRLLTNRLGRDECVIAYPRGRLDMTTQEEAARAGYRWGLTTVPGFITGGAPTLSAPRVAVSPTDSLPVLAWKTSPLRFWARQRPAATLLRRQRQKRWQRVLREKYGGSSHL